MHVYKLDVCLHSIYIKCIYICTRIYSRIHQKHQSPGLAAAAARSAPLVVAALSSRLVGTTHTHTHYLYTRRSALPGKSSEWREAHRPSLYAATFSVRAYRAFSTECFCVFVSVGARRMFGGAQLMEFSLRARAAKQRTRI